MLVVIPAFSGVQYQVFIVSHSSERQPAREGILLHTVICLHLLLSHWSTQTPLLQCLLRVTAAGVMIVTDFDCATCHQNKLGNQYDPNHKVMLQLSCILFLVPALDSGLQTKGLWIP